jgi:hypothetical protein
MPAANPERARASASRGDREQRVVFGGAAIVIVALLLTYAVLPFVRHWRAQETRIESARARVAYLSALRDRAPALERDASAVERTLAGQSRRTMHARSTTLGASALQSLLQDAADASHLVVTRLEVAADVTGTTVAPSGETPTAAVGTMQIPATLAAYGDIAGVAALLDVLATGPRVVAVDRLTMQRNAALLGAPDVVQVTLSVRAPVLPQ